MENQIKDIKEIDLLNYISQNHKMEQCGPNMYRVNPCPICGHRDHFTVYTDTNSWTSFAKCHEKISGGSIIDYVMAVEGAESVSDAIEKLGGKKTKRKATVSAPTPTIAVKKNYKPVYDSLAQDDYFLNRGLSIDVIDKYKLGAVSDETLKFFQDERGASYYLGMYRYVLPINDHFFITRLDEDKTSSPDAPRYRNFGEADLLNKHYIKDDEIQFIFIVEGYFDALSIETLGHHSIALNSVSNASKLMKEIKINEEDARQKQFILLADNDEAGKQLEEYLQSNFKKMNMSLHVAALTNYKDINEYLIKDSEGTEGFLEQQIDKCINGNSAFNILLDFFTEMKPVEPIKLHFPKLNDVLGGLRTGLYVLGAISSLGKTTFVQEVVDKVAEQGEHVLFFSLEMGRKELVAKSLVRTMGELKVEKKVNGEITYTRDLLSGKIKNQNILTLAIGEYEKTAKNLFVHEGMFDIDVYTIRQEIEKHIRLHNKKPIIVVDYLQILQPVNDRMTEKQTVDKNITELKRITRDFEVPLIAVSSFNRGNYNSEASFSAFKESGAIEYSSDVVLALELEKVKDTQDSTELNKAKSEKIRKINLKVLKNRFGKAFEEIQYDYITDMNKFKER
ncbi:DnaB-like helicase C-terminal domain-containing protein [Bacillus sp. WOD8 KX774193]|uniref:DnaB-like helicase C-terminal domain-containing protein n=1 Tax=Bacillus sp. WOD8 KX774193 TaxID=3096776 RepID=UPI002DB984AC|nr:DnaB-like helicase C-terminal domain-containing protein [Bacillus sp. WOD8 KX774193]MEC3859445.1 DnaB-like helicase C-terminal domain-containing protein [Bacillus sp. WOD8 KX774193]